VCAIALGLAGPTTLLGRAKEVSEFIRHGAARASVELELAGGPVRRQRQGSDNDDNDDDDDDDDDETAATAVRRNVWIQREIRRDNSSVWRINGKKETLARVKTLIKSFHIQIDNLCQFLPQDRVCNFAELNAAQLLQETEKAIGGDEMLNKHLELVELRNRQKEELRRREMIDTELLDLRKVNDRDERDVQRYLERAKHLEKVRKLEMKQPWLVFEVQRARAAELFDRREEARKKLGAQQKTLQPLEARRNELKRELVGVQRVLDGECALNLKTLRKKQASCYDRLTRVEQERDRLIEELESIDERERDRQRQIRKLEAKMAKLEERRNALPPDEELRAEVEELRGRDRALHEQDDALEDQMSQEMRRVSEQIDGPLHAVERQRAGLLDARKQRLHDISRRDPGVYKAYTWVHERMIERERDSKSSSSQQQQPMFEHHVFGPLSLELVIENPLYAGFVEQITPRWMTHAFVAQSAPDRDTLREAFKQQNFRAAIVFPSQQCSDPLPVIDDRHRSLGIVCALEACVQAPEPVLRAMLLNTPLRRALVADASARACMEQVHALPGTSFVFTPEHLFTVNTSRYSSATSTKVEHVRQAELFRGVDMSQLQALETRIAELRRDRAAAMQHINGVRDERAGLKRQIGELAEQQRALQRRRRERESVTRAIALCNTELAAVGKAEDVEAARATVLGRLLKCAKRRVELIVSSVGVAKALLSAGMGYDDQLVRRDETMSQMRALEKAHQMARSALQPLQRAVARGNENYDRAKRKALALRAEAERATPLSEEIKKMFATLPTDLDELMRQIHMHRAQAEQGTAYGSERLVNEYRKRVKDMGQLQVAIDGHNQVLGELAARIEELRTTWLAPLKVLIGKISAAFSAYMQEIGCAGGVELAEHEDYDQYGVRILVQFRKDKASAAASSSSSLSSSSTAVTKGRTGVQRLSAHFHSGGERSVATMLYLISMQKITDCPFRLVDEINQGMDPRNERMIFEQVARAATLPGLPQYFLITPKLLPDLNFSPAMTVLCIYNGPRQLSQQDWVAHLPRAN
jgi:structural maintenance of chromosomes protein 5